MININKKARYKSKNKSINRRDGLKYKNPNGES